MTNKKIKPELTPLEEFVNNLRYEAKRYGLPHLEANKKNSSLLLIVKKHGVPESEVLTIIDNIISEHKFELSCKK